jgi:LytS/YehU family sensor histidine kinase
MLSVQIAFCQSGQIKSDSLSEGKSGYNRSQELLDSCNEYQKQGNYKKAYDFLLLYKKCSDSIMILEYNNGLTDARIKYETAEREKEIQRLMLNQRMNRYIAYGLSGVIFLIVVIGFMVIRQMKLKENQRIKEMNHQISEMAQKNLRPQMNPHFIFNTLNSIQFYMYQNDKIATNNYLTTFSRLMRKILENSDHPHVPIQDELDALTLYLDLECLRFKDKFVYEIIIDDNLDTLIYQIPPMFIQPFVENAIVHGLMNKEGKGSLELRCQLRDNCLDCVVTDDGVGREAAKEKRRIKTDTQESFGTRITETRLNLINKYYGTNFKINYTDLKDSSGNPCGTRVEFSIPIMAGL